MNPIGQALKKIESCIDRADLLDADPDAKVCENPACDGYGHVLTEGRMRDCMVCRAQRLDASLRKQWGEYGLVRFGDICALPNFDQTAIWKACNKMYFEVLARNLFDGQPSPYSLVLLGGHGTGKTMTPLAIHGELLLKNIASAAYQTPKLMDLKTKGVDGRDELDKVWHHMENARFVFLDEFSRGTGRDDHFVSILETVLAITYCRKHLVISSNDSEEKCLGTGKFKNQGWPSYALERLATGNGHQRIVAPSKSLRRIT